MTESSIQNDTLTLEVFNNYTLITTITLPANSAAPSVSAPQEKGQSFDNYTQVSFEKDFFKPSNGLTVVIEDDRVYELTGFLQRGYKVKVKINGNLNMVGYIFDYKLEYARPGGTKLTIECKDLLEYMAQGSTYPNMGKNAETNLHFKPTTTLRDALQAIANCFLFGYITCPSKSFKQTCIISSTEGILTGWVPNLENFSSHTFSSRANQISGLPS